ncbi:MAG: adenylate/guanylate cyclase domain-containing protein [Actinomyces sp.]|nr:adenylate/guanylate cyclase domain-containing protein [Actinomyces sp.]
MLLGGQPHLTARDLAGRTGTPLGRVDEFWLAMGFRTADPDEVAFTTRDLEAYGAWSRLIDEGAIDLATGRSLLRAQSHISDRQDLDDTQARRSVLENMEGRVDFLEHALVYSWRRQLESLIARVDREVSQRGPDSGKRRFPLTRSLGFVDMVSYTSSSTILGSKLVGLIERFEDASRTAVTAAGGRVVKMIGDAVLFIADDLATGLRVVTSLIEALGADDQILPVRASFVRGDVFSRSGDVFGPPVNLASRLVDIAPEGRILTDATTAAAIAGGKGGSGYHLEDFPSAELRGFGTVSPYLLARDTQ